MSKTIYLNSGSDSDTSQEEAKLKAFDRPSKDKDDPIYHGVVERFWMAFDHLRQEHGRGWQEGFIKSVDSNIGHFSRLRREKQAGRKFRITFLVMLVKDWSVNPNWLLTGRGKMFKD